MLNTIMQNRIVNNNHCNDNGILSYNDLLRLTTGGYFLYKLNSREYYVNITTEYSSFGSNLRT
jgi:hypothetical protein